MPPTSPQSLRPSSSAPGHLASIGRDLQGLLGSVKRSLEDEIRTYPTPIPRCDAQFNHLYEQRTRLSQLLDRVNVALEHGESSAALIDTLVDFVALPSFSERADEWSLRERIGVALAKA